MERHLFKRIGASADVACEAAKIDLSPWQSLQTWLPIQGAPREEAVRRTVHDILVHLHGTAWSFIQELAVLNSEHEGVDRSELVF